MPRNKKITRIATGITAGALLTVGAATIATSANAAPRADVNSTTPSTASSSTAVAPGKAMGSDLGKRHGHGKPGMQHGIERGTPIHGEMVVKNADGTYSTHVNVNGTATAVSTSSITVKADDGFTATFAINSKTDVRTSSSGGAITDVKVGDAVHVDGTKSGSTLTADDVHAGMPGGPKAKPAA